MYDLRKFEKPFKIYNDLYNNNMYTGIDISPDRKYIVTGTSKTREKDGELVVIDI